MQSTSKKGKGAHRVRGDCAKDEAGAPAVCQEFPGTFFFKGVGLMLLTYVDDLTLSGPADAHEAFWEKHTQMINVERPEPTFRVCINGLAEPQEHDLNAAVSALKGAVAFDMNDYARQTVELFVL